MLLIRGTRNGKQKIIGNEVTNGDRVKSVFFFPMFNFALPLVPLVPPCSFPVAVPRFHSPFSVSVTSDLGWIDDSFATYAFCRRICSLELFSGFEL